MASGFTPSEGGVKIVFDVAEADVRTIAALVSAAGFAVQRYYRPDGEHGPGRSQPGHIRLGAERAMSRFDDAQVDAIVSEFDQLQSRAGFSCVRVGTDSWTAGDDGPAGDREPRVPRPKAGAGSAAGERGSYA